jgi:hypothetical protein
MYHLHLSQGRYINSYGAGIPSKEWQDFPNSPGFRFEGFSMKSIKGDTSQLNVKPLNL